MQYFISHALDRITIASNQSLWFPLSQRKFNICLVQMVQKSASSITMMQLTRWPNIRWVVLWSEAIERLNAPRQTTMNVYPWHNNNTIPSTRMLSLVYCFLCSESAVKLGPCVWKLNATHMQTHQLIRSSHKSDCYFGGKQCNFSLGPFSRFHTAFFPLVKKCSTAIW